MNKTKIETADYTWNPVTGCDNICFDGDCYAYQMIKRFGNTWGYDWTPLFHDERMHQPFMVKEPSLIFAPSMGDLFTPSMHSMNIESVLDAMARCPWHRFMVQTKFAERLPEFSYPSNVWLGVSLCYKVDVDRLDYLKKTDARIKHAYCEPLLEGLVPDFKGIDWVVIGAKTGSHKLQPDNYWVSKLTIMAYNVGAKVFHKPNLWWPSEKNGPPFPIRQFPDEEWFEWRKSKLTAEEDK